MPTPQEELAAIDAELQRRPAGGGVATQPPPAARHELDAIDAELQQRGALPAMPAPGVQGTVQAPGGPPQLPPVTGGPQDWAKIAIPGPPGGQISPPGAPVPPPRAPAPPGAAGGRKVTAKEALLANPFFGEIVPNDIPPGPYTNQFVDQAIRGGQEQSFLQSVAPSGKQQVKRVHFATSPFEEKLRQQNAQLDRVHQQLGPQHQPVAGGPIDLMKRHAAATQAQLFTQLRLDQKGALWQDWNKAAQAYGVQDDLLQSRLHAWQQGKLTGRMAAQLRQDMQDHEVNRQALVQRRAQLLHYSTAFVQMEQAYKGQPIHYGPMLPEEIAARQGGSLTADFAANLTNPNNLGLLRRPAGALKRALGWVNENVNPAGSTLRARPEVDVARRQLMLEGKFPPLPPNPGHTPQERADFDRQTKEVRQYFFSSGFTPAFFNPKLQSLALGELARKHLTPWQQQLVPVFKQMLAAEEAARGPELKGVLKDAALWELAAAGGQFVGRPLHRTLGRVLVPLEARLEASTLNPLVRAGAKFATRTGAAATAHGTGAAVAGGVGGAGIAAAEGQDWQNILDSARQGALQTAGIGAVMGAGWHVLTPRATIRASASEFYHQPVPAKAAENLITLPDGSKFDLNKATRAELETLGNTLPADHPARVVVEERLYGPAGSHRLADVTGRQFAARDLSLADIQGMLQDYANIEQLLGLTPAEHANRQALEQHRVLHEAHAQNQRLPVRPEAHQELRQAYRKEPVLGQRQENILTSAADALQGQMPEVAHVLREAASQNKSDFQTDYRQADNVSTGATPEREPSLPAPRRSAWRRLSPEVQRALPEPVRRTLILQDIRNSGTIIEPRASARDFVNDLSRRGTPWLEAEADRRWQQAEGKFASERAAPASTAPAPGLERAAQEHQAATAAVGETAPLGPGHPESLQAVNRARATGADLESARDRVTGLAEETRRKAQAHAVETMVKGPGHPDTLAAQNALVEAHQAEKTAREQVEATRPPKPAEPAPEPTVEVKPKVEPRTPNFEAGPRPRPLPEEAPPLRGKAKREAQPLPEAARPRAINVTPDTDASRAIRWFHDRKGAASLTDLARKLNVDEQRAGEVIGDLHRQGLLSGLEDDGQYHTTTTRDAAEKRIRNSPEYLAEVERADRARQQAVEQESQTSRQQRRQAERKGDEGRKGGESGEGQTEEEPSRVEAELARGNTQNAEGEVGSSAGRGKETGRKPGGKTIAPELFAEAARSKGGRARGLESRARGLNEQVAGETSKQRFLREAAQQKQPDPDATRTPTVKKNLTNLADAVTGRPVEFTGFRSESKGGRIPATGVFYAVTPGHALRYAHQTGGKSPSFSSLTVEDVRFENPFVANGGHADLAKTLATDRVPGPSLDEKIGILRAIKLAGERGTAGYALIDKAIAGPLRRAGYDALIYRKGGGHLNTEIVDLRSHEAGTDGNGRPVRQPEGTPAKDVSDWQHWGLGFPAGWEMNRPKPVINPEGEIGRKGGAKLTGAGQQLIDEAADPQVAEMFAHSRGNPVETDPTVREATRSLIANSTLGVKRFVAGFRRTFPDLVARDDPELHRMLVERVDGRANAAQMAERRIHDALRHLTPDEKLLWDFRRTAVSLVTDAGKQFKRHIDQGFAPDQFKAVLPDGITEEQAKTTLANVKRLIREKAEGAGLDPAKLEAADQAVTAYRQEIVPYFDHLYHELYGVDLKLRDNIETYMRHQILFLDQVLGEGAGPRARIDGNPNADYLRAQLGSELPYNTNWVEAEMDWLPRMIRQIGDMEIVKHINDNYNIAPAMRLAEAELNSPGMIAGLEAHAAGNPLSQAHTDVLARMAAEHHLPDRIDSHYKGLLDALLNLHAKNEQLRVAGQTPIGLSPEMQDVLKEYTAFLQKPEKDGTVSIRSIVDDPRWQARNNYGEFQPVEGRHYWQGMTVPEKMLQAALSGAHVLLDPEQLQQVTALGAKRRTMVVPLEMKRLLEGYTPAEYRNDRSFVRKPVDFVLKLWKWDKLYNPAHSAIYFLNNARSDADATFRGHTRAYWDLIPRSIELVKFMRGAEASPILKEWLDRNGLGSTFVASAEMQTGVGLNPLRQYATREQPVWKQRTTWAKRAYHNALIMPHEWREATFRYTNFYTYVKEMENNGGMPRSFGASDSTEIRGLANIYDRAMALSNDLIGPYNKVSAGGQWVRKNAFPFWSWQEVLVHRELQLFRNALLAPRIAMEGGQRLSGGQAGLVWGGAMLRYFGGLATYGAFVEMLNRLRFGTNHQGTLKRLWYGRDYREMLPKELRGRTEPVMLWRRNPETNQLLYLDRPTNFFDFADIFHLNGIPGYFEAISKGQMTKMDMVVDMLGGPRDRLSQQLGPQFKLPAELSYHMANFPDPSKPHKIEWMEAIARELSLDKAYQSLMGVPMYPPGTIKIGGKEIGGRPHPLFGAIKPGDTLPAKIVKGAAALAPGPSSFVGQDMIHLYNTGVLDLSDANYYEAKSDAEGWLRRKKQSSGLPGSETDAQHEVAYQFRKALRYGDRLSMEQSLWQYARLGGTDKSMKASLYAMEPLHRLPEGDQARYLEQLHRDDKERLRSAYMHWANIVAPSVKPADHQQKPFRQYLTHMRAAVRVSLQREWGSSAKLPLGKRIDQGRSLDPAIQKVQQMPSDQREEYLGKLSPQGGENLKQAYRAFAGRAGLPELKVDETLALPAWVKFVDEAIREFRRSERRKANKEAAHKGKSDEELEKETP